MKKNSPFSPGEFGPIEKVLFETRGVAPQNLSGRVCIHLHLYYPAMAEEFSRILNHLTIDFVLLVSVPEHENAANWEAYFKEHVAFARTVIVKPTPNKGRDVLPWVVAFADEIQRYEVFCHMHTKQSRHMTILEGWREFLARRIFGSPAIVNEILGLFHESKPLGLVYPPYFGALSPDKVAPEWGDNRALATHLLARLSPGNVPQNCPHFPAGSFFWARVSCLAPLFALGLTEDEFEEEAGQLDGTMAHAIERVVGALPNIAGMEKLCVTLQAEHPISKSNSDIRRYSWIKR